jgi:hypothetical protein
MRRARGSSAATDSAHQAGITEHMEEEKSTLIGIQMSGDGAQITWYDRTLEEPQTLSLAGEREDGLLAMPADAWKGALRGGRFGMQSLSRYITRLIGMVPGRPQLQELRICLTVPNLTQELGDHLVECLESLGIARRNLFLQDWRTSFFYYVISMRRELWSGDVAFLRLKDEKIAGSILHIDRSVKPALVTIREIASADVSDRARAGLSQEDWDRERDRRFYELLGKLFERRSVTTSYLYGTYFDRSWAERSFQYLTFRRHAFQGQNLFSKGACYSAMMRVGLRQMPDLLFMGVDMVTENIGMRLRVRGREQYQLLIPAGVNWYEAHSRIEMIPDGEKSVTILTTPMEGGETVGHILRLDHFPERERRATRLRMTIYFTSAHRCEIEVEDLGFGQISPSSGRVWRRQVAI